MQQAQYNWWKKALGGIEFSNVYGDIIIIKNNESYNAPRKTRNQI